MIMLIHSRAIIFALLAASGCLLSFAPLSIHSPFNITIDESNGHLIATSSLTFSFVLILNILCQVNLAIRSSGQQWPSKCQVQQWLGQALIALSSLIPSSFLIANGQNSTSAGYSLCAFRYQHILLIGALMVVFPDPFESKSTKAVTPSCVTFQSIFLLVVISDVWVSFADFGDDNLLRGIIFFSLTGVATVLFVAQAVYLMIPAMKAPRKDWFHISFVLGLVVCVGVVQYISVQFEVSLNQSSRSATWSLAMGDGMTLVTIALSAVASILHSYNLQSDILRRDVSQANATCSAMIRSQHCPFLSAPHTFYALIATYTSCASCALHAAASHDWFVQWGCSRHRRASRVGRCLPHELVEVVSHWGTFHWGGSIHRTHVPHTPRRPPP